MADGGHRRSVVPGSNLARLSSASLRQLKETPRVAAVVARLGYGWQGALAK